MKNKPKVEPSPYLKRNFSKDFLVNELDLPYNDEIVIKDEIVEHSRWSVLHDLIFKHDGVLYQTNYTVGATEYQDESPWEFEDDVDCYVVEAKEVTAIKYVKVKRDDSE